MNESSIVRELPVFAGRAIRRLLRTPEVLIASVLFPVVLMLTFYVVFRSSVQQFSDGEYAQLLVPGLVMSGVMFGSAGTAVGFLIDRQTGFADRMSSLPINQTSYLGGIVVGETARSTLAVVVLGGVGHLIGFRFHTGVFGAIGFVLVAAMASMSVVWVGLSLARKVSSQEALGPPLNALFLVFLFFSRGLVPLDAYPGWAQPLVRFNPASAYVRALDRLAAGGETLLPVLVAVAWSVGISGAFIWLSSRAERTAS